MDRGLPTGRRGPGVKGGWERLLEAIAAVEKDFGKILVISHVEEVKHAFPARVEVVPGPDGSKVRVA